MGRTAARETILPAFKIIQRAGVKVSDSDGAVAQAGRVWGTYLHGIFADPGFRASWLDNLLSLKGLWRKNLRRQSKDFYDMWAVHLRRHLDMKRIFTLIELDTLRHFS